MDTPSSWTASSAGALASSDKAEAATLSFRSHQDALDYAAHRVEYSNRIVTSQNLNAIDLYLKGEVAAYVRIKSSRDHSQYELAFLRVPTLKEALWHSGGGPSRSIIRRCCAEMSHCHPEGRGNEGTVFLGVTELVQSPKETIPSFIWLEANKERQDFRREMLVSLSLPVPASFNLGKAIPEREIGLERFDVSAGDGACVPGLVKDGAQVVGSVEQDAGQHIRWFACKDDFVHFLSRLRILINDVGPRGCVSEVSKHGIKIEDVMLCAVESEMRAMENVCHERETRSDERP